MKQIKGKQERLATLETRQLDDEARTVEAALSSETPVQRFFGIEVLEHTADAVNFERAATGLPLLWSHDHKAPIGRIDNIRIDSDRVMRGTLKFSNNPRATEIWQDVKDGFLRDMSVGYSIDDFAEEDDDVVRVTKWTPLEASVVTVPADNRAGLNRKHEEIEMSEDTKTPDAAETETRQQKPADVGSELKLFRLETEKERRRGAELEAQRRDAIRDLFSKYEDRYGEAFYDLRNACERNPEITVERAKEAILEAIADGYVSVDVTARQSEGSAFRDLPKFGKGTRVEAGVDQSEKFERAMTLALQIQAGHEVSQEERAEVQQTEWYSMSVADMARNYLRMNGERPTGEKHQIIGKALQRSPSHGTSHFASVLENVANKAMVAGFVEADEGWNRWANVRSVPDFKATSLLNMSLFTDLDEVREGGEYEYGDMSDLKEIIQLATYGKLFGITRQALANDDMSALGMVPGAMGRAVPRCSTPRPRPSAPATPTPTTRPRSPTAATPSARP